MAPKSKRHVFDPALIQDIMTGIPGSDGRIWVSYGTVELDENLEGEEDRALTFDEDAGPLVEVRLQPSDKVVTCRVATPVSGVLQSQWVPLVGGDEVVVVLPMGQEQSPPVVIARLNNALDKFPEKVAGKDARQNNIAFTRTQTPTIIEAGSLYMIRSAQTGALIGIDEEGNVTVRDGNSTGFQFGPSGFAVQDADGTGQITLNTEESYASIWWQSTVLKLDGTDINLAASGNVAIGSAGNTPVLHGMASEQAVNLLVSYTQVLAAALNLIGPTPLTGSGLATVVDPAGAGMALITAAIALAGSNGAPTLTAALAALTAALQGPAPTTPLTPGVGCAGFIIS
jgi:hypothetical protein